MNSPPHLLKHQKSFTMASALPLLQLGVLLSVLSNCLWSLKG